MAAGADAGAEPWSAMKYAAMPATATAGTRSIDER
jgi:hypothetical protein